MTLIGRSLPKTDNPALASGKARFVGDLVLPGMLHGRLVRSPLAHARIRNVDVAAARALPGVVDVIVPSDVAHLPAFSTAQVKDMRALAVDRVRFVGDALAGIVAETPEIAEEAAALVELDLEELPVLLDPEAALQPGAVVIHVRGQAGRRQGRAQAGRDEAGPQGGRQAGLSCKPAETGTAARLGGAAVFRAGRCSGPELNSCRSARGSRR